MSLLLTDPMVHFPKKPMLMPTIQFIIDDAVTVYGSVDGPFRMNGSAAKSIIQKLIPYLRQGVTVEQLYLVSEYSNQEVNQLLEILYIKSCLIDQSEIDTNLDYFFARNISKYKNHKGVKEFKDYVAEGTMYIFGDDAEFNRIFVSKIAKYNIDIQVVHDEDGAIELKKKRALGIYASSTCDYQKINHYLNIMDVLYINTSTPQIGPLFSTKGILPKEYDSVVTDEDILAKKIEANQGSLINLAILNAIRIMGKVSNTALNEGFYKKVENRFEYVSLKSKLHEHTKLSIQNFERFVQFPASKFINASSHLEHYKSKNLKLSVYNQASFLWKKLNNPVIPEDIHSLLTYTLSYKNPNIKYKRFAPTGGNINSNLLFYVNKDESFFNGKGIYFYNNVDDTYYQVLDDAMGQVTKFEQLLGAAAFSDSKGYLIISSDVDTIVAKYADFGFKIANLNSGVCLSNILTLAHKEEIKLKVLTSFDEAKILELLGVERSNEIINFVLEVM